MKETVRENNQGYGYNHSQLYINILDKHYLCVSRYSGQTDAKSSSQKVYIGKSWSGVIFPDGEPLIVADDFYSFKSKVTEKFGGMKALFNLPTPVKIYVDGSGMVPFFLYFLAQTEQAFGLNEFVIRDILKKTNERFWIWDNLRLNLSTDLYREFKKDFQSLSTADNVFEEKSILSLPFEFVLLMYGYGLIKKDELLEKLNAIKPHMVGMSLIQVLRSGLETLLNDPRVLKEYNGVDIEVHDDVLPLFEEDELLNGLFIQRLDVKDISWIESHMDKILSLMMLLKKYDLDKHDPFPSYDDFKNIHQLFYDQDQEKALNEIMAGSSLALHELDFFKEYQNKINTTLVNYVSCKLIRERKEVYERA